MLSGGAADIKACLSNFSFQYLNCCLFHFLIPFPKPFSFCSRSLVCNQPFYAIQSGAVVVANFLFSIKGFPEHPHLSF